MNIHNYKYHTKVKFGDKEVNSWELSQEVLHQAIIVLMDRVPDFKELSYSADGDMNKILHNILIRATAEIVSTSTAYAVNVIPEGEDEEGEEDEGIIWLTNAALISQGRVQETDFG
jgi:hypothetical protein